MASGTTDCRTSSFPLPWIHLTADLGRGLFYRRYIRKLFAVNCEKKTHVNSKQSKPEITWFFKSRKCRNSASCCIWRTDYRFRVTKTPLPSQTQFSGVLEGFFIWKFMSNSLSSRIALSMIFLYALDEQGQIQLWTWATYRHWGGIFLQRGRPWAVFFAWKLFSLVLLKYTFFSSLMREIFALK